MVLLISEIVLKVLTLVVEQTIAVSAIRLESHKNLDFFSSLNNY
jgi:hypothetical protein